MKITVFTPTYNRAYTLGKLYQSLKQQTYRDFEWLVIDDGSKDETDQLFRLWNSEMNDFPIRYIKVPNGGKHRAINKGTDLAMGELFFIVDSDDYLTNDALGEIVQWEAGISNIKAFCGISGNRGNSLKQVIGDTFEGNYVDATALERQKYKILGDKAEVYYTAILKQYKFDEIEGEKFLSEATVWERMAYDGYKIRWFNRVIYICDYLNDGLTNNIQKIFAENPKGVALYFKQQIKFYNHNLKGRLSYYNLYYSFVKSKVKLNQAANYMGIKPLTLLLSIVLFKIKESKNLFSQ